MENNTAKVWFWWLLDVVLVVAALAGLSAVKAIKANEASRVPARTIVVSAEGKVVAVPDIARLSFSVIGEGQNPKALEDENTKKVNSVIDFVKAQGVDPKDIKTVQYELSPRYDYDKFTGESRIYGYTLTQTVAVKIRDFKNIGPILEALPGRGVNQISSLSFDVDEPDSYLEKARQEAFGKARKKAGTMAGQNGVRLGKVITFNENVGGYPIPVYRAFGEGVAAAAPETPRIEPGSQEITVQVSVTYEIK